MEKDKPRGIELEQELEALYKEVAGQDYPEDTRVREKGTTAPAMAPEVPTLHNASEAPPPERKMRRQRLFRFVLLPGSVTLLLLFVAFFFWPTLYRYDSVSSGGRIYPLRINCLTGRVAYFDGGKWLSPPIPVPVTAVLEKKVSAAPDIQPVVIQPAGQDKPKDQTANSSAPATKKTTVERKYAIQVKAYPAARERDAAAFLEALKKSRPDVYMEKIHVPGRGVWHRILLGHFASADEASNYMKQKKISEAYPGCFVQLKSG